MDDSRFNLDRLLELAKKATPGPWTVRPGNADVVDAPGSKTPVAETHQVYNMAVDAEYIAAASPDTIITLIERVKDADKDVQWCQVVIRETFEERDEARASLRATEVRLRAAEESEGVAVSQRDYFEEATRGLCDECSQDLRRYGALGLCGVCVLLSQRSNEWSAKLRAAKRVVEATRDYRACPIALYLGRMHAALQDYDEATKK